MAKFTAISDVSNAIIKVLREYLVPEVVMNKDSIGLCSPDDPGDVMVGVYLYDITENTDYRDNAMMDIGVKQQKYPSTYLTLHYMITAYVNGDSKFKTLEEHKILGKVVQIMSDYNVLDELSLETTEKQKGFDLRIEMERIPVEDKIKIWPTSEKPYKLSLFYSIVPIEIESMRVRTVSRVSEVDISLEEKEKKRRKR